MRHIYLLLILTSCSVSSGIKSSNSSRPYDYESAPLHIDCTAYTTYEATTLYAQMNRSELLYTRENPQSSFVAKVTLNYLGLATDIVDTLKSDSPLLLRIQLPLPVTTNSFDIEVIDLNRKTAVRETCRPNEFLVWDMEEDWAICGSYATVGREIEIVTEKEDNWYVRTVNAKKFLPDPPFTGGRNNYKDIVDSLKGSCKGAWTVVEGSQRFKSTNSDAEFVLYGRSAEFPEMVNVEDLIESTRYISTVSEYKNLIGANHPKQALDDFWIKCGDTPEQGKELIEIYYGRVEEANRYFSGLLEGWRTDRGMVHIIMGPPTQIRRDFWNEYWIYGDVNSVNNYTLRFRRKEHEIDNNIYILERNPAFRITWEQFVTSWRNGRVYGD